MKSKFSQWMAFAVAGGLAILSGPAFAQTTPPTIDYADAIGDGRNELIGALATSIGPVLLMIAVVAAISWAVKMFRRAVKSA